MDSLIYSLARESWPTRRLLDLAKARNGEQWTRL